MLDCQSFYNLLSEAGIKFYTGVPDSTLKDFCAYLLDNLPDRRHVIAANEGNAVGIAAGYHLATGSSALVYLQNSGLGNAANPLISLASKDVYSLPLLMLVGWRGEPGKKDEPQHLMQGRITLKMLDTLELPYQVLPEEFDQVGEIVKKAVEYLTEKHQPYALVARRGIFSKYQLTSKAESPFQLSREEAIKIIVNSLGAEDIVVSTTGKASRELFEYREQLQQGHAKDFLTVGSMGHSSQIAMGIALQKPDRQVYCLDGDGAAIMHMGAMAIIASKPLANYKHIILNNGSHDSVGGQPTVGFNIDLSTIAKACGYREVLQAQNDSELPEMVRRLQACSGPALLEIKLKKGARKDLGRPTRTPLQNKQDYMTFLKNNLSK